MQPTEQTFTDLNGYTIYQQQWVPHTEPKAVILLVHGLGEHSGRYMNVVNYLVPQGFVVCGYDHPGHGRSSGRREYIAQFEDYLSTLKTYSAMVRSAWPDLPVFLVGHSMGGLIATWYLTAHQQEFSGAILSAPALQAARKVSLPLRWSGQLLAKLTPHLGLITLNRNAISRDPQVVRDTRYDPLFHQGRIPARLAAELERSMRLVPEQLEKITLPLLILQGGADRIVNPQGARLLHDTVSSTDKTLLVYPPLYHEVFNEPEHPQVLADVAEWLAVRLG